MALMEMVASLPRFPFKPFCALCPVLCTHPRDSIQRCCCMLMTALFFLVDKHTILYFHRCVLSSVVDCSQCVFIHACAVFIVPLCYSPLRWLCSVLSCTLSFCLALLGPTPLFVHQVAHRCFKRLQTYPQFPPLSTAIPTKETVSTSHVIRPANDSD